MAGCCEEAILPQVTQFVTQNLTSEDWKKRDAAIMALGRYKCDGVGIVEMLLCTSGSVMEGPDPDELQKYVPEVPYHFLIVI